VGVLLLAAVAARAADPSPTNTNSQDMLLTDSLGRTVKVPTNEVRQGFQPPTATGLKHQFANPSPGTRASDEILRRIEEAHAALAGIQFFPAVPPRLPSYLLGLDEYGNTLVAPGALIDFVPFEPPLQGGKYWLSEQGLRYSLEQTLSFVNMSDVIQGANTLGYYTLDFKGKWSVFDAPGPGTAGWISSQLEVRTGLGGPYASQSAKSNLGTVTDPTGIWSSVIGLRVPELAWQESFLDGEAVLVAGMINPENYFDKDAYADSGRGKFINSALINSMVLPLAAYNFGANLQWQPCDEWYAMLGGSVGNTDAGQVPWTDFRSHNWSLLGEFGYTPKDFLGLGPGIYRIQPFVAQVSGASQTTYNYGTNSTVTVSGSPTNGPTQGGLGFNLQQQLGPHSPFGWFGRFGFGWSQVSAGASAQAGTGFVMHAPLKNAGLVPRLSNDLLGVGLVWSQPATTTKTVYYHNEYVLEAFYTLQLSPTVKLQPDFQYVWNPAFNPANHAMVAQLQLVFTW
jgi:carbohydrate-selective porin OprB